METDQPADATMWDRVARDERVDGVPPDGKKPGNSWHVEDVTARGIGVDRGRACGRWFVASGRMLLPAVTRPDRRERWCLKAMHRGPQSASAEPWRDDGSVNQGWRIQV